MRLRGGKEEGMEMVTVLQDKKAEKEIQQRSAASQMDYWSARGLDDFLPNQLTELETKKKAKHVNLTYDELAIDNVVQLERKLQRSRRLQKLYNGSAITHEIESVQFDLLQVRKAVDKGDEEAIKQERSLARRLDGLIAVQRELYLETRYKMVVDVVRDDEGRPIALGTKHSKWIDLVNEKVDDVGEWELGLVDELPSSRYVTGWSKICMGRHMEYESRRTVVRDLYPPDDCYAASARGQIPLPKTGVHYFEICIRLHEDLAAKNGQDMEGGTYVGLVDGNVTNWDEHWELESDKPKVVDPRTADGYDIDRRHHIMALHDSCARARGEVSWAGGLRKLWVNGSSYGHGDRVGFLVNMDTRTVNVYKNGFYLGKAWGDLPDEVYPFVTLMQPGQSAEILFPKMEAEISRELRQSALYLEYKASLPPLPPPPPDVSEMAVEPYRYRKELAAFIKQGRLMLKNRIKKSKWNIVTCPSWIRYHKSKWALWALGMGKEPVTRFVNEDGEKLVMRGDGNSPPLLEEEDEVEQRKVKLEATSGDLAKVDDGEEEEAVKEKKKSLPWKLYRKAQKEKKRSEGEDEKEKKRRESRKDDEERVKELKRLGRPTDELIVPSYGRRSSLKMYGLKRPRAVNNPRQAAKKSKL